MLFYLVTENLKFYLKCYSNLCDECLKYVKGEALRVGKSEARGKE